MELIKTANSLKLTLSEKEWKDIGTKAGWIKEATIYEVQWVSIPKGSPPDDLRALSQVAHWCTSDERIATNYINHFDFHILLINGSPAAAVVVDGKRISQMVGPGNWPVKENYIPLVKKFLKSKGVQYTSKQEPYSEELLKELYGPDPKEEDRRIVDVEIDDDGNIPSLYDT